MNDEQRGGHSLPLTLLPNRLAVCRLDAGVELPPWALAATAFVTITRTESDVHTVHP